MTASDSPPGEDVATLRRRVAAARAALAAPDAAARGARAIDRFFDLAVAPFPPFAGLGVALYRSVGAELDLEPLERRLRAAGADLYFPRVLDRAGRMEFVHAPSTEISAAFATGAFGIPEPRAVFPGLTVGEARARIRIVFVPGVAFGENGERIGMGGGFYDRLLGQLGDPLRIAVAYDLQLLPALPQRDWDQPVDWILTERREIVRRRVP